jgi:glutaredoxin
MKVILYSTPTCPKCKVLEAKLGKIGIEVQREMNEEILISKGLKSVPWIEADNLPLMDFSAAIEWIKTLPEV